MPLQNRVDPAGSIHAVAARGLFTGNRGVIHDPATRTLTGRGWTTKAWIVCRCDFKGRTRDVFGRNAGDGGAGWTNLFFLDEVTALAAGHRPCFACRRAEAAAFAACFAQPPVKAAAMDAVLHRQRRADRPLLDVRDVEALPDGAVVQAGGLFLARKGGTFLEWSFDGYGPGASPQAARLVTPPATVAALAAGYRPVWHQSAC